MVAPSSIYRFIYHRSAQKDYWHRLLPCAKHRRGRFGRRGGSMVNIIKQRRPVSERSNQADDRKTPGHWEADFMLFAQYGQSILIAHERASRFTIIHRPQDRKADRTAANLAAMIHDLPDAIRQTMTFDNGPEFAFHHRITEQTGIQTFFCDVRSPWQKGGIENAIGRLRRALPRKANLDAINPQAIVQAAMRYNHTPRKCLDFLTPDEAFNRFKSTVALQT